jgi:polyhydroxyalkanoate synthesis regulator phasin
MSNDERIKELERTVKKIENYLIGLRLPSIDAFNAKLKALEKQMEELEKAK